MTQFVVTQAPTPLQPVTFQPTFESTAPRAVAVINGATYPVNSAEVRNNAHGATASATIVCSIAGNPDFSVDLFRGDQPIGGGFTITNDDPVFVQIYVGHPAVGADLPPIAQLTRVWFGVVDQYSAAFHEGLVTFTSRSLGAPLVDNEITRISVGETSLQFIAAAAALYNLKVVSALPPGVDPVTIQEVLANELIGGANFSGVLYRKKWWDMILQCAMFDNVDVWVDQDTLYYAAPSLLKRNTIAALYGRDIALQGGATGTHSPQFNKNVRVEVHGYQKKTRLSHGMRIVSNGTGVSRTPYTRKVTSTPVFGTPDLTTTTDNGSTTTTTTSGGTSKGSPTEGTESSVQRYTYFYRNITPAQANRLASALWRKISMMEYFLTWSMPLTPANLAQIAISSLFAVSGLPYRYFNDTYYPRALTLTIGESGAYWTIEAINHQLAMGAV